MRTAIALAAVLLAAPTLAQDIRVIDGDTFEMDGETIRLWGIDAPEMDQPCRLDGEVVYAGQMAADILADVLLELDYCDTVDTDRWGRIVARCHTTDDELLGRHEINSAVVLLGGAWDYRRFSGGEYDLAESVARVREYGIWSMECTPPWEWREQN